MRQLKFRCFDKLSPKMYAGHSLSIQADGTTNFLDDDGSWKQFHDDERIVVMQFTGRKDINGKDIYEGDVIRHGESIRFIEVRWCNYVATRTDKSETLLLSFSEAPEVIGNIYENPELLTQQTTH